MYRIVWEFEPDVGRVAEFEREYGGQGAWSALFRRGVGYLGTELLRSTTDRPRYLTVDRWISRSAYEAFRAAFREEYAALDARCAALTRSERLVSAAEEP
ncbi:MAG TPA: antibiotic biosynthesis monooxygenase [Gemmatimonadales bacterium]